MDYHEKVCKIFDVFYQKVFKTANFNLDLSRNKQRKQVDNFIKLISKNYYLPSIGTNFFISYFCFQFEYWENKKTKRNVSLGWIIGKKAFKRWIDRSESSEYFSNKFLLEYAIDLNALRIDLHEDELVKNEVLDNCEEIEKIRFTGEARLFNCLHHTTMFNHRSGTCLSCPQSRDCKILLKAKYPFTYKKRGYK